MTKEQFVEHWRDRIAGMALRGLVLDNDRPMCGAMSAGHYALMIPAKVDALLERMFLDATNPTPASNGQPVKAGKP